MLNRRSILKILSMAPLVHYFPNSSASTDDLSFADQNGFGPHLNASDIEYNLVPLHRPIELPGLKEDSDRYQAMLKRLKDQYIKSGKQWSSDYKLKWSYQHYGMPLNSSNGVKMLSYCKSVQEFLYKYVLGVDAFPITWSLLKYRQQESGEEEGISAKIGRYTYFLIRVGVDNTDDIQSPYLLSARPVERAVNFISHNNHDLLSGRSQIYLIVGRTALVSPFSEILHLVTHTSAMEHNRTLNGIYSRAEARSRARYLGEAVTESAAITLARHYLRKTGHSERLADVRYMEESLTKQLPRFKNSMRYMKEFSVQKALESYQRDPTEFQLDLDLS